MLLGASGPPVAGMEVGGSVGGKWNVKGAVGGLKHGSQAKSTFTTLYYAMSIGKEGELRRDRTEPETVDADRCVSFRSHAPAAYNIMLDG